MKKIFISVLTVCFALSLNAQSYKPAVKLEAGKKYEVVTTLDGNNTAEVMGQSMETPIKSTTNATLEIKGVTDKGYTASYITTRLQFNASSMGQEMNFDSDNKEDKESAIGKSIGNVVGGETTFTVNNDGNIVKETIVKPKEEKKESTDMMESMLANITTGNASACPVFDLFTGKKEIKIADSFVDSSSTEDKDGKSKVSTTYTLTEIKDGIAIFSLVGKTNIEKKMEQMGQEMVINSTVKSTGELLVNIATGLLTKKTVISESTGTLDVQGMSIPVNGKTTTSIVVTAK